MLNVRPAERRATVQVGQPRVPPFEAIGLAFAAGGPFGVVRPHAKVVVVECRRQGQDYVALVRGDVDGNAMHTAPSIVVWTAASTHWARLQRRGGRGRCHCWKRWSQGLRADRFGPCFGANLPVWVVSQPGCDRTLPAVTGRRGHLAQRNAGRDRPFHADWVDRVAAVPEARRVVATSSPGASCPALWDGDDCATLRVRAPPGRRCNRVRYGFSRRAKHRRPICVRWPRGSTWPSLNRVLLRRRRQIGWRSPRDRD